MQLFLYENVINHFSFKYINFYISINQIMGNSSSRSPDIQVFKKELVVLNGIVNNIINEKDVFKNNNYNFLSQDVCEKYQIILEEELTKYLKLDVKSLGTSLYIIPKDGDDLTKFNLSKKQICEKISNHYIKILYVMSLVKYVYNIERDGDLSIAGIIIRNIRVLDDIMEINFCDLPHKNYALQGTGEAFKINFGKLEGFKFFVDYFLDKTEAKAFIGVVRTILARNTKQKVEHTICSYVADKELKAVDFKLLEQLYMSRFGKKLTCSGFKNKHDGGRRESEIENENNHESDRDSKYKKAKSLNHNISMGIFINKDNPIFAKDLCFAPRKVLIKTSTTEGRQVLNLYNTMKDNYNKNVKNIVSLLDKLVVAHRDGTYTLKDIDKHTLDSVLEDVKVNIKSFYLLSIIDYQNLLDKAKLIPSIEAS